MLSLFGAQANRRDAISRREMMRIGGLGFSGLMWADYLRSKAVAAPPRAPRNGTFGKAKACILIFNYGGPSHLDIWDLKPSAPAEIRGEFKPIATKVPGISITEHLPRLAARSDRYTVIRSVNHRDNDHAIGAYLALTGYSHPKNAILGIEPPATPQDFPSIGSVVSKLRPAERPVFSYVTLGELRHFGNNDSLGQNGGSLGRSYDPYTVPFRRPFDCSLDFSAVETVLSAVDRTQLHGRQELHDHLTHAAPTMEATAGIRTLDDATRRAYSLLSSSATREAFQREAEPLKIRSMYGSTHFGQNCLLARRLVEAGVPLVTLYSFGNRDWDTHGANFTTLKNTLLPPMDQGVSALLDDLENRGMLDETLVIWMGDMGRTPRINNGAGRDHWSYCYSIMMAGAGVKGGLVHGSSDRAGAYPSTNPVGPADVAATIHHCLGIDPRAHVKDQQGRPLVISSGTPIHAVLS